MIRPNTFTLTALMIALLVIALYGWWTGAWR